MSKPKLQPQLRWLLYQLGILLLPFAEKRPLIEASSEDIKALVADLGFKADDSLSNEVIMVALWKRLKALEKKAEPIRGGL